MRFENRVLVCTGAASGMGQAVAERYAAEGGRVALLDMNQRGLEETASRLEDAITFTVDLSDPDAVQQVIDSTVSHYGQIDSLYNGAGLLSYVELEKQELSDVDRLIGANLMGTLYTCRAATPHLRQSYIGAIVNTTSVSALIAYPRTAAYAASKGGVLAMSRTLAGELAPIRVNSIAPGRTLTGMTRERILGLGDGDIERGRELAAEDVMLKRMADPSEMASVVCFLLSQDASYVTGVDIPVDGGLSAQ